MFTEEGDKMFETKEYWEFNKVLIVIGYTMLLPFLIIPYIIYFFLKIILSKMLGWQVVSVRTYWRKYSYKFVNRYQKNARYLLYEPISISELYLGVNVIPKKISSVSRLKIFIVNYVPVILEVTLGLSLTVYYWSRPDNFHFRNIDVLLMFLGMFICWTSLVILIYAGEYKTERWFIEKFFKDKYGLSDLVYDYKCKAYLYFPRGYFKKELVFELADYYAGFANSSSTLISYILLADYYFLVDEDKYFAYMEKAKQILEDFNEKQTSNKHSFRLSAKAKHRLTSEFKGRYIELFNDIDMTRALEYEFTKFHNEKMLENLN